MADIERVCMLSGKSFRVSEAEQEHLRRLSALLAHLKAEIPVPQIHPVEAMRRACCHGNYFFLFRGQSALSGKTQLTRYHPLLHSKICTVQEFWNDEIDNTQIGRAYDFRRPFFAQLADVFRDSYLLPLVQINCEGSEYVNGAKNVRDSYLCFDILESQDCLYCFAHYSGHDNVCCVLSRGSQYCFECLNIDNCYECQHCTDCVNCANCFGCLDLIGCRDCYGCSGLRNAVFHLYNQPLSKAAYDEFVRSRNLNCFAGRRQEILACREFAAQSGHRPNYLINIESSSGKYLRDCRGALQCCFSHDLEDCGYLVNSKNSSNCWRGMAIDAQFSYHSVPVGSSCEIGCYANTGGEANLYSVGLEQDCSHCFGCAALRRRSYCILNRQYSRSEYLDLAPRIVKQMELAGEWGLPLPPALSCHYLEHSLAQIFFAPLAEHEAHRRGYHAPAPPPESPSGLPGRLEDLPDDIERVADDSPPAACFPSQASGRLFAIQRSEIAFHRRFRIPLPRTHWMERIEELWAQRELVNDSVKA